MDYPLQVPSLWNLSRKHFRAALDKNRFIKLNRFENRLNTSRDLKFYCYKLRPRHVYSVLNWLFPERIGKKYARAYVCEECLGMSKRLTLQLCEIIQKYYSKLAVVFSGCQGFHVHFMDFNYHDWAPYKEKDPIWCHAASRFKFKALAEADSRF